MNIETSNTISVHKDGMSYMGYKFSCSWDREHALGFMMKKREESYDLVTTKKKF